MDQIVPIHLFLPICVLFGLGFDNIFLQNTDHFKTEIIIKDNT